MRLVPGWSRLLLIVSPVLLAAAALGAVALYPASPAAPAGAPTRVRPGPAEGAGAAQLPPAGGLLIQVSGAVEQPGLYRVAKGERTYAAIAAAGGLSAEADRNRLPDLAARLKDGQQVKVPSRSRPSPRAARTALVDLNFATLEELETVPGFSADLAAAAIDYRTQYGGFTSIRELVTVLGMGEADYQLARRDLRP